MSSPLSPKHSHPGLFSVCLQSGDFNSWLRADKGFAAGDIICSLDGFSKTQKAYTSVQFGEDSERDQLQLNSDLTYTNHSCEPNVALDLSALDSKEWHVRALKSIEPGDSISFFYPTTEWDMAQGFQCNCMTQSCVGQIRGAKYLTIKDIESRGWINPHIRRLIEKRDGQHLSQQKSTSWSQWLDMLTSWITRRQ